MTDKRSLEGTVKFKLDLSSCATKANLNNVTVVDTWKFAKKIDLASLKSEIDKLDITPFDLIMLSDVIKMKYLQKICMMYWLKSQCYSSCQCQRFSQKKLTVTQN